MKHFWVKHKRTGDVTIARYSGGGKWHHFGHTFADIGLLDYEILKEIEHLEAELRPCLEHETPKAVSGIITMTKTLNVGGTTTATVSFQDKAGETVSLPAGSVPAWSIDQTALASMTVAADGLSAEITGTGVGLVTVTVVAEGDPTPGVDTITVTGSITIVDEASSGTITFS